MAVDGVCISDDDDDDDYQTPPGGERRYPTLKVNFVNTTDAVYLGYPRIKVS